MLRFIPVTLVNFNFLMESKIMKLSRSIRSISKNLNKSQSEKEVSLLNLSKITQASLGEKSIGVICGASSPAIHL